eukprot:5943648-Pyramimonas_sp.AAC.1
MFAGRVVAVLPVEQWIATQDRPRDNAWHPVKNYNNFVQLTQQFMHGAAVRNLSAVPMSLATQPFPVCHPPIKP